MATDTHSGPILFATDFSEASAAAGKWAVLLAAERGAILEVVHILTPLPVTEDLAPPGLAFQEDLLQAARRRLDADIEELRADGVGGVEVTAFLGSGSPPRGIVDRAEQVQAAAIVLGTQGGSGVRHLFVGTTTERVVQHAPCPVLAVHPDDGGAHPVRTLLLPTDFSSDARIELAAALSLFGGGVGGVERAILVHAFNLAMEYTAYGTIPTSIHFMQDAGLEAERRLAELASQLERPGLTIETVAAEGYPPDVIRDVARDRGVDVIALATHGRSGLRHLLFGSVAERVVERASRPVLTVHRPE